jgi:hypothetical protein
VRQIGNVLDVNFVCGDTRDAVNTAIGEVASTMLQDAP